VIEDYLSTSLVTTKLSDSTEYFQCVFCVGHIDEEMYEEIEIVSWYPE
jgi:hypothetical protein